MKNVLRSLSVRILILAGTNYQSFAQTTPATNANTAAASTSAAVVTANTANTIAATAAATAAAAAVTTSTAAVTAATASVAAAKAAATAAKDAGTAANNAVTATAEAAKATADATTATAAAAVAGASPAAATAAATATTAAATAVATAVAAAAAAATAANTAATAAAAAATAATAATTSASTALAAATPATATVAATAAASANAAATAAAATATAAAATAAAAASAATTAAVTPYNAAATTTAVTAAAAAATATNTAAAAAVGTATSAATTATTNAGASTAAPTESILDNTGAIGFTNFRLLLGTNLDVFNGFSSDKLYFQLNPVFLLGKGAADNSARWLVDASFFRNKSFRNDSSGDLASTERVLLYPYRRPVNGKVEVVQTSYQGKSATAVTRTGFHAVVGWRIPGIGDEEDGIAINEMGGKVKKVSLFLAGRAEFYQRTVTVTNSYDSIPGSRLIDTVKISEFRPQRLTRSSENETGISFWGIGLPFWVLSNNFEFRLNPFIGLNGLGYNKMAYILQANVTEKRVGVSLGLDYRGFLNGSPPVYNMYIAKTITFNDIVQFLKFN